MEVKFKGISIPFDQPKFSQLRNVRPQIFVDLDGVLADLDGYYRETFGVEVDRSSPDQTLFWNNINNYSRTAFGGHFYKELPLLPDALQLWRGVKKFHLNPIILTGGGDSKNYPETAEDKRWWVNKHLGYDVPMICCLSREKAKQGQPGDILIDDWTKWRHIWQDMGGVFILHTSAVDSLQQLTGILPKLGGNEDASPQRSEDEAASDPTTSER